MTTVVADASVVAAIVFREKGADKLLERLDGEALHAPELLKYELANIALSKARAEPDRTPQILSRLAEFFETREIRWHHVDPVDVVLVARATGLTAYDASYLWLAGWLEADLVTLDKRLSAALEA